VRKSDKKTAIKMISYVEEGECKKAVVEVEVVIESVNVVVIVVIIVVDQDPVTTTEEIHREGIHTGILIEIQEETLVAIVHNREVNLSRGSS
jgi:hypothetical protein